MAALTTGMLHMLSSKFAHLAAQRGVAQTGVSLLLSCSSFGAPMGSGTDRAIVAPASAFCSDFDISEMSVLSLLT
jgi:hypothetical protein